MTYFRSRSIVRLKHIYPYFVFLAKWLIRTWKGIKYQLIAPLRLLPLSSTVFGPVKSTVSLDEIERNPRTSCAMFLHTLTSSVDVDFSQSPRDTLLEKQILAVRYRGHVVEFLNARFWGRYAGWIIDCKDRVVLDVSHDSPWSGPVPHGAMNVLRLPPLIRLKGTAVVLSTPEVETNYAHWLLQLVPRLHLLNRANIKFDSIDYFLINSSGNAYQKYSLAKLRVPNRKIMVPRPSHHLSFDRLIVPSYVSDNFFVHPFAYEFLNNTFSGTSATNKMSKRIYLSRGKANFRRITNDSEVQSLLKLYNFQTVHPENFSIDEQAQIFREADIIIGPHGAALANLVFCKQGTRVLEIFSPNMVTNIWWQICQHRQCHHEWMIADRASYSSSARDASLVRTQDIVIEIDALRRRIDKLLN